MQNHVKQLNFYYENGLNTANTKTMKNGDVIPVSKGTITYYNALAQFTGPKEVTRDTS